MVRLLLFLGLPAFVGSLVIFTMFIYSWRTETLADAVEYLADATAFLFLIAAINGLLAWWTERKGKRGVSSIFHSAMHNTAGVGVICFLVLGITYIFV